MMATSESNRQQEEELLCLVYLAEQHEEVERDVWNSFIKTMLRIESGNLVHAI